MRQGTGITPAVNYSVGTGELLSLTKKDVKEDAIAWTSEKLIFRNEDLTPFNRMGFDKAFKLASAKNDKLFFNNTEGDQNMNRLG